MNNNDSNAVALLAATDEDLNNLTGLCAPLSIETIPLRYSDETGNRPLALQRSVNLVVVAAPKAREAERLLLRLYRENAQLAQGKLRTLLLCDAEHSEDAYESCLDAVFDDYLIFHPLQDPDRLRLSIRRGMTAPAAPAATASAPDETVDVAINALKATQAESREAGSATKTVCSTTFERLDKRIAAMPAAMQQEQLLADNEAYRQAISFFQQYTQKYLRPILDEAQVEVEGGFERVDKQIGTQINEISGRHSGIRPMDKDQPRILVIDDDEGFRKTLCQQLMHEGYAVTFADTATKGVALMARHQPHLVLMDLNLPDFRGVESVRLTRKLPATNNIPIIIMSGQCDDAAVRESQEAGAVDFLPKPIRYGVLKDVLKQYAPLPGM